MLLAGVLAAATLLAGCGGDDDDDDGGGAPPAPAPSSIAGPPPASAGPAGPALVAKGLTVADLPEGFGVDPAPPDPATLPTCIRDGLAVLDTATERLDLHFSYGPEGPYITQVVGGFDPGAATGALTTVLAAVQACPGVTTGPSPGLGDESQQLRVGTAEAMFDLALLRAGDVVSVVLYSGTTGFDDSERTVLYRIAGDKLQ